MDERTVGARRGSKFDEITKDIDLAGEHYQLEMYENNEVNSKNLNNATPLNGNVCDVNLMKTFITALSESDRFEDQDFENLTLGSAKYVAEQVPHPKERRARRNVHGKRKSRAGTLREIKLSSVENLDQTTEQLSPKHPLVANNRHSPVQTLNERKMLKFTKLVNSPLGVQLSAYQEETCETANVDVPVIPPTELDLPSEDRTPPDFHCKSATWEIEEPTVQAIGGDGETWTSFPATLGDCDTISEIDSENTAYVHHDCLVNVDKQQSKSCATKTPTPSLDAANQWKMTAETFNLNSAGNLSEGRKICSRRVSSVGARGSPETNSLICYIAKQKMQESQRVSMMKSKMAAFMGTFQDDNNNPVPELPHPSGLWQTDSISTSCRKPTQKKKVTFGGELTPELFDKRLPSNTPLRRGEMPVHQQITFSDSPPSALKQRAKTKTGLEEKKDLQQLHGAKMTTLMFNFNISASDDVTCNGSSPVKDHNDNTSSKLQTKLEDDLEISAAGTQNVEEDRCYPISINFEIESPLSECKFGPDNQKCHNKTNEYPCKVLEVKIEKLTETLPLPISSSGHPMKRKNAKKCTATVRRNLTKKKSDSKKLLKIQPDVDNNIPAINMLESTEIEAESVVESDMNHLPSTEMSKTGDVLYLCQKKSDYSSNGGVQTNFNGHPCPNIENLSEQRDKIEDKNVCNEALDADVLLNPTTKSKKTRNGDHESTKEEPRRSSRIKSNVKNISKNSTATKGKCKQKFKKSLYGKREYASKKPLLSPIAEVLDIWSESTDFSNSEAMLECETPKRTSLIHLEGVDRGRRHSMSESFANGWTPGCTLRKSVGQKPRGRPRKGVVHCFEKEQKIQSDVESETQKGNTGDHRLVPRRLNQFDYNLKCDNSQFPSLCENKKDMAFEVKWTDNVAKDGRRGKSLIKIKSKPFSKLPVLIKSTQKGITDTQSPSEGQWEMETGHEEYFERINTDDYGGASSFLESESNGLEDVNERLEETDPNEIEKLIPIGAPVSEKSQETISELVTDDITVFDDNIISPPEAREEFRSRSSHRQSKLVHAIDLPYVTQTEQVLKVNGCCVVNAGDENEEKDENLSGRKNRKERLSWKGIAEPTVPYQIDDVVDTANCESLLFNFGDHCFLEQINTSMLETVNQPETCIKHSDGVLRNTKSKKKVRRSARLSGCMNREGLRWIEVTSPQHLEKRNKNITMRRRSFGLIESECNVSNPEDIAGKIASQARMRKLRRRSLSCNREGAFELEEPLRKSIVLD